MALPLDSRANAVGMYDAPHENFARGLLQVDLPAEFGQVKRGKVRDNWVIDSPQGKIRVKITTDRQSAFDRIIGTFPGKGQVLNLLSKWWFENTTDIVPNHMIAIPHPNVLIARHAPQTLPVEFVLRRYMAKSSTSTSIYDNYVNKRRREIYGIRFPEGLRANQELPDTILTPTTKAVEGGHDEELTEIQARDIVDRKLGNGIWDSAAFAAKALFERAHIHCLSKGLILPDMKLELGVNQEGILMLIDEFGTPDSSRFWRANTYMQRFAAGENPDTYDKEILRRWLAEKGFKGEGPIPIVDTEIIDRMVAAYRVPYELITGEKLPEPVSDQLEVRRAILDYFSS